MSKMNSELKQTYIDLKINQERAKQFIQEYEENIILSRETEQYVSSYVLKEKLIRFIVFLDEHEYETNYLSLLMSNVILYMHNGRDKKYNWNFETLSYGIDTMVNTYYKENVEKSVLWFKEFNER